MADDRSNQGDFMKKFILCLLLVLTSLPGFSKEVELVQITNDEDNAVAKFYALLDEHNDLIGLSGKKFIDGIAVEVTDYGSELDSEGITVKKLDEYNVVILRSSNIHASYGGQLELDFLYNGITGSRGSFEMSLEREGNTWKLYQGKKSMTHIHMYSKKKFWKTIGIKAIKIIK